MATLDIDLNELLQSYQRQAQQGQAQQLAQQGMGSIGFTQSWMAQQNNLVYPQVLQSQLGVSDYNMRIRFNRINEVVEINEYDRSRLEPLDELRIKVANWLYN